MRAKFGLPSVEAEENVVEKRPPIRVKFEIPYFTVSGIQVLPSLRLFIVEPVVMLVSIVFYIVRRRAFGCPFRI